MLKRLFARDDGATLIQVLIGGAVVLVIVVTAANWGAGKVEQTVDNISKANDARNSDLDALIAKEFKCKGSASGGTTGGGKAGGQTVSPMVDYLAFTCPEENEGAQLTGMVPADNGATVQRQNDDPADGGTVPAAPRGNTVQQRPEDDDHSTSTNTTTTTETETSTHEDPPEDPHGAPPAHDEESDEG